MLHLGDILVVPYQKWEKGEIDCHGKGENTTQNQLQLLNKLLPWDGFIEMFLEQMPPFAEHRRAWVQ